MQSYFIPLCFVWGMGIHHVVLGSRDPMAFASKVARPHMCAQNIDFWVVLGVEPSVFTTELQAQPSL